MPHHKFKLIVLFIVLLNIKVLFFFRIHNYETLIADEGISGEKSVSFSGNLRPINDPIMISIRY